jgi:hypothetical protein
MPGVDRPPARIQAALVAVVFIAIAMVFGFVPAIGLSMQLLMLVLFLGWAVWASYVGWSYLRLHTVPVVEGRRLVQRDTAGRERAAIDLEQPFECTLVHFDGSEALYRVTQGRRSMRLVVTQRDEQLVRTVLGMRWPPPSPSAAQWTP